MTPLLADWLRQWVHPDYQARALQDLQLRMATLLPEEPAPMVGKSEAAVSVEAQLRAKREHDALLWRNNSGAYQDDTGRLIRYGLGNTSKEVNALMKSPDYVGVLPHLVTPADVGQTLGLFLGVECKEGDWQPGKDRKREEAQETFGQLVLSRGGLWKFYRGGPLL